MSTETKALPAKLYFRIGEVASLVGVEPHVLRYWEREFRTIRPTKSAKGQRVYSRRDVENLMRVRDLLYAEGFTIAGAKKKLLRGDKTAADANPSAEDVTSANAATATATATDTLADPDDTQAIAIEAAPREAETFEATRLRTALTDLRADIEAFLHEIQ